MLGHNDSIPLDSDHHALGVKHATVRQYIAYAAGNQAGNIL